MIVFVFYCKKSWFLTNYSYANNVSLFLYKLVVIWRS